jgi:hypothetical protein
MSEANETPSSTTVRRCRKCRETVRGHPKGRCPKLALPVKLESASVAMGEFSAAKSTADGEAGALLEAELAKSKVARPGGSRRGRPQPNFLPQQSIEPPTVTVDDTLGFQLGLHYPISPARVRFALSLLEQMEGPGVSGRKDETGVDPVARSRRQKSTIQVTSDGGPSTASSFRTALKYLTAIILASALTIVLLAQ